MKNVHQFPLSRRNARKGAAVAAIVAAAAVVLGAASLVAREDFSTRAMSEANASAQAHALVGPANASRSSDGAGTGTRDFDYFPSHYRNQATAPAEPIATF